jgi:predicted dehydrogenase
MTQTLNIALVGLDTSHTVEFARRMQTADCPAGHHVPGLRATACLRFETPFQNKAGLDERQKTLEGWGVKVTENFDEAVAHCDAIIMTINDASYHLDYFRKCVTLGKPIFLDKPLADTLAHGREIATLAATHKVNIMSCSSLRHVSAFLKACTEIPVPAQASTFGPLGKAPAGSSIVWYGVHAFEMLERAMGRGAVSMSVMRAPAGVVCVVEYPDHRRGVVELSEGNYAYGGAFRGNGKAATFVCDMTMAYTLQLVDIANFFRSGTAPLVFEDALEVMSLLEAAQQAFNTGKTISLQDH